MCGVEGLRVTIQATEGASERAEGDYKGSTRLLNLIKVIKGSMKGF